MKLRIAQLQMKVLPEPELCLKSLAEELDALDPGSPDLVALGEMFCCPYDSALFPHYAEPEGGHVFTALSALARQHRIYLSAGSVPEIDADGKIYNTAYVFDRTGNMIAKHRKMHLFDVNVRGGQVFRESDSLSPGDHVTVFDTEFGPMGLCICFDIRFPELARLMVLRGARLILVPAAFNETTGPAHWELAFRSRALDNQCFYAGTSDALDPQAAYHAWGHSILVSPWGTVIAQMDERQGRMVNEINLDAVDDIRAQLPLLSARRTDVYNLTEI